MKFIHMADLHIGGWREQKMSLLTLEAFKRAVDDSVSKSIDFLLISGDLFNTSLPNLDYIKETVKQLKRLKTADIPVYIVAGSHDFSPSGKTMLDVLEHADLLINVTKAIVLPNGKLQLSFTVDTKTGVKIAGMLGKKNMLEKGIYEAIDYSNLIAEKGFKIFMFHTAIDELKPRDLENMESSPLSLLPKGFDYYAGGHVHIIENKSLEGYKHIIYPGPLFPNSFSELEKLHSGGYYLYDNGKLEYNPLCIKNIVQLSIDCANLTPEQVTLKLSEEIKQKTVHDTIVLIRLKGKLKIGKLLDISLKHILHELHEKGAYFVMKNTSSVTSPEFEEVKKAFNQELLENEVISEHLGQTKIDDISLDAEKEMVLSLIKSLSKEKVEGETNVTYEERMLKDVNLLD